MKIAILLFCSALYAFQQPPEGTAESCRTGDKAHPCDCRRAKECDKDGNRIEEPGAKCKTYCKPEKCFCKRSCHVT